ncbi:MAG: hypothetical protein PHE73_02760 [Sulfurovaceae bacterium]|nr:hypothetical protein [Sulfurovaceae bacterium]
MTYANWLNTHFIKHKAIMEQLVYKNIDEIIEYFDYENMRLKHPEFCPLYATNSKCHYMKNLNCYMCGCPYFRFNDDGIETKENRMVYSICTKGLGELFESENAIHQDCSNCILPHTKDFIRNHFNWNEIFCDVRNDV